MSHILKTTWRASATDELRQESDDWILIVVWIIMSQHQHWPIRCGFRGGRRNKVNNDVLGRGNTPQWDICPHKSSHFLGSSSAPFVWLCFVFFCVTCMHFRSMYGFSMWVALTSDLGCLMWHCEGRLSENLTSSRKLGRCGSFVGMKLGHKLSSQHFQNLYFQKKSTFGKFVD